MKQKIIKLLREANDEEDNQSKDENLNSPEYKKVQNLLDNEIFNHAAIVKELWGNKNATNRSKFRKKLHQETNDSGDKYSFNSGELSKIIRILTDTSSEIRKSVGGQKIGNDNKE